MKKLYGMLVISLLLAGCAGHSNTPDGVAKGFLQALVDNQTAEAFKLSNTTMSQDQIHGFRGFSPEVRANANGVAVQRTKQSDSEHAVVDVRLNLKDGNYYDFIYHVVASTAPGRWSGRVRRPAASPEPIPTRGQSRISLTDAQVFAHKPCPASGSK